MSDSQEYSKENLKIDPRIFDEIEDAISRVDLSRDTFINNVRISANSARDYARTFVTTLLPEPIIYLVNYGCSYDGNKLQGDEKTFPEDYSQPLPVVTSPEEVTNLLWREGFVPQWINVAVSHEDGKHTYIKLDCCGRFSATPRMMYHVRQGHAPFHILSPPLPPDYDPKHSEKFDLYWMQDR